MVEITEQARRVLWLYLFDLARRIRRGDATIAYVSYTPPGANTWERLPPNVWLQIFVEFASVEGIYFSLNQPLASRGFLSFSAVIPFWIDVKPNHQTLTLLASHAYRQMRQDFRDLRLPFDQICSVRGWPIVTGQGSPTVVTALAYEGTIYLASSARAGQSSIMSVAEEGGLESHQSLIKAMQSVHLYDANQARPFLHHQNANCGEMAVLLLWAAQNSTRQVQCLQNSRIITVHHAKGDVIEPCRSCALILDGIQIDYGTSSLVSQNHRVNSIMAFLCESQGPLADILLIWELSLLHLCIELVGRLLGYRFGFLGWRIWVHLNASWISVSLPHDGDSQPMRPEIGEEILRLRASRLSRISRVRAESQEVDNRDDSNGADDRANSLEADDHAESGSDSGYESGDEASVCGDEKTVQMLLNAGADYMDEHEEDEHEQEQESWKN